MRQTLEQVNTQIGSNRNARHQLERDLQNKDHAIGIDHSCHQVRLLFRGMFKMSFCRYEYEFFSKTLNKGFGI